MEEVERFFRQVEEMKKKGKIRQPADVRYAAQAFFQEVLALAKEKYPDLVAPACTSNPRW